MTLWKKGINMNEKEMRLGLYRKIEVARKQLPDMDEVAFRSLLRTEFGVESRKEMTVNQLSRLVHYFASNLGVKYTAPAKSRNSRVTPHGRPDFIEITDSMPFATQKRQILAIWRKLGYSMTSLDTRVKREFGTHCFVWLQNGEKIKALLTDLQHREKAFDKKQAQKGANVN
ncbi:MAG: regulatory protein GemA [Desulfovibrio sp.]|nr:regulatory protein GemA [Desulfovibrio sp.]